MKEKYYRINEIFYSLQGEGRWAGRAAIFIRFSGCNLKCPFCDTDFSAYTQMSAREIIDTVKQYGCDFVVLTGGEPTLQVENPFIDELHEAGFYVAMETNGTRDVPSNVDWVTCSPKDWYVDTAKTKLEKCNEIKLVVDDTVPSALLENWADTMEAEEYYIQPCDTGDKEKNTFIINRCVEFVKNDPRWKLSLQQQKILNVR